MVKMTLNEAVRAIEFPMSSEWVRATPPENVVILDQAAQRLGYNGASQLLDDWKRWPEIMKRSVCPECRGESILAAIIICLTSHEWLPSQIADWMEE